MITSIQLKLFYEACAKEPLMNPFITYPDKRKFHRIQVIHSGFQVDHINPMESQLFEAYRGEPDNSHLNDRLLTSSDVGNLKWFQTRTKTQHSKLKK